jgi:hypothetical protein
MAELQGGGPLSFGEEFGKESQASLDSDAGKRVKRYVMQMHMGLMEGVSCDLACRLRHAPFAVTYCGLASDGCLLILIG